MAAASSRVLAYMTLQASPNKLHQGTLDRVRNWYKCRNRSTGKYLGSGKPPG